MHKDIQSKEKKLRNLGDCLKGEVIFQSSSRSPIKHFDYYDSIIIYKIRIWTSRSGWFCDEYKILRIEGRDMKTHKLSQYLGEKLINLIQKNIKKLKRIKEFEHKVYFKDGGGKEIYFSDSQDCVEFGIGEGIDYNGSEYKKFLEFYNQIYLLLINEVRELKDDLRIGHECFGGDRGFDLLGNNIITKNKYDRYGYDIYGFDKKGKHCKTRGIYDDNGFDVNGYDKDGFDRRGIHKDSGKELDQN